MPEFILATGGPEGSRLYQRLGAFAKGYVEAMFFTSEDRIGGGDLAELAPEAIETIERDCERFQAIDLMQAVASCPHYSLRQAGRDFWYSRNGHGTGFFDREKELGEYADQLQAACGWRTPFPEQNLCRGDDGRLYLEG
jgi:hypothetical protein